LVGRGVNGYVCSTLAKINATGMTKEYLFYFLQGKYALLNTKKKGTGTPHLNVEILKTQKLCIPDVDEQQCIVNRIEELFSELDKAVETLRTTKEQLSVYRQVVLKEAFANIDEKKSIREMTYLVTSGSRGWAKFYSNHGARFIRITDLTREKICLKSDNIQYVDLPDNAEGKRSLLQKNDVLVSITADLGSVALVPEGLGEAYINQHIAMIRFKNDEQSKFMAWYLKSDIGQKDLLRNKRGGGKLGLGLDDIRDTLVPVVSDKKALEAVNYIEEKFSVCDSIEQTVDTSLQQAEALRQSILKQAFEGEL
jgi:type I restriction enzyme S subunit